MKRLTRYLVGLPRLQTLYEWQGRQHEVSLFSDADWAGDGESRKSTSAGCITIGGHTIKGWSKTQSFIALSSWESELYAALRTATDTLGIIATAKDFGYQLTG